MSSNQAYHTWVKRILQCRPSERITRIHNMAHLLIGIWESKSVHLSHIATKIPSLATLPSVTRRLARFLDNPTLRVREWYQPILCDLLQTAVQSVGEIRLIADGSQIGKHHQLLMLALSFRRRAVPLVWTWMRVPKGHSSATKQLALLDYLHRLLPQGVPVVLVGDSEFGAIPVIQQMEQWGWYYVLRQKANNQVQLSEQQPWRDFGQVVQHPGESAWYEEVCLTQKYAHPTNLLAHWQVGEAEPWLLATNLPERRLALRVYGRRMWIEEMFGDLKGHGFHLAQTHLQQIARLSRLTLAVVLVYVWMIATGTRVVKKGERRLVDRAERRDLSLFQIGLRWLERRVTNSQPIPIPLTLGHTRKLSGN